MVIALRSAPRPEEGPGLLLIVVLLLAALSPVGMVLLSPTIAIAVGADEPMVTADQSGCLVAPAYQPPCPSSDPTVGQSR